MPTSVIRTIKPQIPNCLTVLRMIGSGCLLLVKPFSAAFFIIYTLSGITDVLDGWIARKTGMASPFGARLDSIADLLFYGVMLLRIFPALWPKLPGSLWLAAGLVCLLRLSAYVTAAVRYRRFASVHTYLNKLTGAAVFTIPYLSALPVLVPACWLICGIAALASGEELLMHLLGKTYQADRKTILEGKQV